MVTRGLDKDGNPGAPTAATRLGADRMSELEQRVQAHPTDVAGWQALAAGYADAGRYGDAVRSYDKATQLDAGKAALWSALGEARVMASEHDPMPPAAVSDFQRALSLDAKDPRARYFHAVARDLGGDHQGAIGDWLALLADTPSGAPWEADLRRTIEQVGKINHINVANRLAAIRKPAVAGIPGPTPEQLRAAAALSPSEQNAMALGMVARLEARLHSQPGDADGWLRLIRSRMTLGQPDKASAALAEAVAANPAQARNLRQQAGVLGVR